MKKRVFIILFVALAIDSMAQQTHEGLFFHLVEKYKLTYTAPIGYEPMNFPLEYLDFGSTEYRTLYWLEKPDKTACMAIRLFGLDDIPYKKNLLDPNLDFLAHLLLMENYQGGKVVPSYDIRFFPLRINKFLKTSLCGEYCFSLKEPVLGRYKHCLVKFFQKNDSVQVFIFHLFESGDWDFIRQSTHFSNGTLKFP